MPPGSRLRARERAPALPRFLLAAIPRLDDAIASPQRTPSAFHHLFANAAAHYFTDLSSSLLRAGFSFSDIGAARSAASRRPVDRSTTRR